MYSMFGGNTYYVAMIQHFSFTFFLFLILQRNFFPLRSRHQTSETKLRYSQSSAFYRQPKERQNEGHIKYVAMHIFVVAPKSVTSIYLGILYLGKKVR